MGVIDGLYQQAKSDLASAIANDLKTDIHEILAKIQAAKYKIEKASETLKYNSSIYNAAKNLQKSMQKQGYKVKTLQDVLQYFDDFSQQGHNRSRILKVDEGGKEKLQKYLNLQEASDNLNQQSQEQKLKEALLEGYQLIMGIREALGFKHINYGIIYTGINGSGAQQLLMGTIDIETLISQGHLNNSLSIVLEQTGAEINNILQNSSNNNFNHMEDLLARKEGRNAQIWEILTRIQKQLNDARTPEGKRKYYYFYGQLTEALIYLEDKDLTMENIYEALVQGQNTTSFEKMGDFKLTIAEEELDIQAKTFASQGISDTETKTITITSLSNITRVLDSLANAFGAGNNSAILEGIKSQFTQSSSGNESKGSLAKAEEDVKIKIKAVLDEYLSSI